MCLDYQTSRTSGLRKPWCPINVTGLDDWQIHGETRSTTNQGKKMKPLPEHRRRHRRHWSDWNQLQAKYPQPCTY